MTTPRRRPTTLRLGAVGVLALALTGCGAGLNAQTYQSRTVGDATNVNLGRLAVRNLSVAAPAGTGAYRAGGDARGSFTVANSGDEPDTLLEASSKSAGQVVLLSGGAPSEVAIPARGTSGSTGSFILRGLTTDLGPGQVVMMTLRFERSGTLEVVVPVKTTGRTDRPVFTGGTEGEPALQGPAGGEKEVPEQGAAGTAPAEGAPAGGEASASASPAG